MCPCKWGHFLRNVYYVPQSTNQKTDKRCSETLEKNQKQTRSHSTKIFCAKAAEKLKKNAWTWKQSIRRVRERSQKSDVGGRGSWETRLGGRHQGGGTPEPSQASWPASPCVKWMPRLARLKTWPHRGLGWNLAVCPDQPQVNQVEVGGRSMNFGIRQMHFNLSSDRNQLWDHMKEISSLISSPLKGNCFYLSHQVFLFSLKD